jgi:broad-specificity NMP kinase
VVRLRPREEAPARLIGVPGSGKSTLAAALEQLDTRIATVRPLAIGEVVERDTTSPLSALDIRDLDARLR